MGDGGGLTWVGHRLDLVEALLVADADAFVLAEVLVPGADDELLEDAAGIVRVAPHAPADRACAASGVAAGAKRFDEVSLESRPRPILDRHLHRAASRRRVDEVRGWPVAGRQQVVRRDRLEREPYAGHGDERESDGGGEQRLGQPRVLRDRPERSATDRGAARKITRK